MEKRRYQEDIIRNVTTTTDNVLVVSPTGSGKTYIAKRIANSLKDRVLFVTPRIDLVTQTAEAFDYNCDILWQKFEDTGKHVIVASRQTLQRRDIDLSNCIAIFDEAHIGLESTYELVQKHNFKRVIGLTATPERKDGKCFIKKSLVDESIVSSFNPIIHGNKDRFEYGVFDRVLELVTIQDLQSAGYLSNLEYYQDPNTRKLTKKKSKFDELKYDQFKDDVDEVKIAQFLKAHEDMKPFLIFTPDVKSAEEWRNRLNGYNYNLVTVSGSTPKSERDGIYEAVKKGEYDGIVNCALLTYGFDMPCAKTVVLIRNIRSRPLLVQVVGRVLRPYENKTAVVYDAGGSIYNFSTAKNPMLFKQPIKYKYLGEWSGISDETDDQDIAAVVGDEYVDAYIADPLQTLLTVLNQYKLDFEQKLYDSKLEALAETKKIQEVYETELKQVKKQLRNTQDELANAGEVTDPLIWFKSEKAFTWFRFNMPKILGPLGYDKSMIEDQTVLTKVYKEVANELPVYINKDNIEYSMKQIRSYSRWWLNHFESKFQK